MTLFTAKCFLMFASRTNWNLAENRITKALTEHRRAKRPLIDLTLSNATEAVFVYDEAGILAALQNPSSLTYEPASQGLFSARGAVAAYYAEKNVPVSPLDLFL